MPEPKVPLIKALCPWCRTDKWQERQRWARSKKDRKTWLEVLICRHCKKMWTRPALSFRQEQLDEAYPLPPETQFSLFGDLDVGTQESEADDGSE